MEKFLWILFSGIAMSLIALAGSFTLFLKETTLKKITLPLVALSAGSLIGGAFFHMIPTGLKNYGDSITFFVWVTAGFVTFFVLEQLFHWHHCHNADADCRKPLGYLILIGDALHNFIGGLAISATFLVDIRLGIMSWLAAAMHEIPQELGDFGVLIHSGWEKKKALMYNVLSASTFLLGGIITFLFSKTIDVSFLIPYAAGNFLYIGASDLVPEVNKHSNLKNNTLHFIFFIFGLGLLLSVKYLFVH